MRRWRTGLVVAAVLAALTTGGTVTAVRAQGGPAVHAAQPAESVWSITWVYPDGDVLMPDEGEPAGHVTLKYERPGPDRFKSTVVEITAKASDEELTMFRADLEDGARTYQFRLPTCKARGIEIEQGMEPGTTFVVSFHAHVFDIEDDGSVTELGEQSGSRTITLGPGTWCRLA
jgi:hypothetical protein